MQATLNQLSGALKRAVRELADVQQAIESLLARIKKQQFSSTGRLVADETERGCESTLVCGVDAGECYCP